MASKQTESEAMKQHAFAQEEVMILERRIGEVFKIEIFNKFLSVAGELGFKVTVTGGNFLTHEINGNEDDFTALLQLTKGV